jgi:hypothetical protein
MEGHRDCFRTLIRRTLRDELGLVQREAQETAEYWDYWIHRAAVEKACKNVFIGNWLGAAGWGGGAVADYQGTYRAMRYYYFTKEGLKETFSRKSKAYLFRKLQGSEKLSPGLKLALRVLMEIS